MDDVYHSTEVAMTSIIPAISIKVADIIELRQHRFNSGWCHFFESATTQLSGSGTLDLLAWQGDTWTSAISIPVAEGSLYLRFAPWAKEEIDLPMTSHPRPITKWYPSIPYLNVVGSN